MDYNQINKQMNNDCIIRGICAQSPSLGYLQEIILSYLQEISFYLIKLKELGVTNDKVKENIIEVVSGWIIGIEYSEEQFFKIITRISGDLSQAKALYINLCKDKGIKFETIKSDIKTVKNNISEVIHQGQQLSIKKKSERSEEQKNYFELIYFVVKSLCIHMVELKKLDVDEDRAFGALLLLFNTMNSKDITLEELDGIMKQFVELDHEILLKLQKTREEKYGEMTPVDVSLSTRPNKAILVSGTNIRELELLLKATQGRGVDVYTHGHMIMAHSFPKLRAYPNLVGHFGNGIESYLMDFAAFPGAILMTRHSFQKVENLYRSRIFTTDLIAPKGVIIIRNDNFEPLIESALSAKGFTKGIEKKPIKLDLNEKEVLRKLEAVAEKFESGEIKHLITIGVSNHTKVQKDYFEKFLNLLELSNSSNLPTKTYFVLSLSYTNDSDNILLLESDYGFPLLYKTLEILTRKRSIEELNPAIIFTRCEVHTLSNILNLKYMGVKKLYFNDCASNLINPTAIELMRNLYGIRKYTNPQEDIKTMLAD